MGAPIGCQEHVERYLKAAVQGAGAAAGKAGAAGYVRSLRVLGTSLQDRSLLLRYCAAGLVTHLARLAPAKVFRAAAADLEEAIEEELMALSGAKGHSNLKHHERAIRQASLPARMGGLGIGVLTTDMAAVAGMSSAAAALQYVVY